MIELQDHEDVTGRDRTCDAPRFRRALYLLSYGHAFTATPFSCTPGSYRTSLSEPLAHPSTLDRRKTSYAEERWSPVPTMSLDGMRHCHLSMTGVTPAYDM